LKAKNITKTFKLKFLEENISELKDIKELKELNEIRKKKEIIKGFSSSS